LATARWLDQASLLDVAKAQEQHRDRSAVVLGQVWEGDKAHLFWSADDRHLMTIAGSRAGKGRGLIIPNLLAYRGSVICIDPKGENAAVTAAYRRDTLGQNVVILDPFGVLRGEARLKPMMGGFNPLEGLSLDSEELIDEVNGLADALVISDNSHDPHWNESARIFLRGVILLTLIAGDKYQKDPTTGQIIGSGWTLTTVQRAIATGLPRQTAEGDERQDIQGLLAFMLARDEFDGAIASSAHLLAEMGERERGSVLSTLRRHLEFLESPPIGQSLKRSTFDPRQINTEGTTLYLVLPEWRLGTHARWLRLVITSIITTLQRIRLPAHRDATLFILDEFATLRRMDIIERAAGYIAGFGVKLWVILQDLNQLKSLYQDRWETFLGNSGTIAAFGNSDITTIQYLSSRLGETEVIRTLRHANTQESTSRNTRGLGHLLQDMTQGKLGGLLGPDSTSEQKGTNYSYQPSIQKGPLMTPDEIARLFAREQAAVLVLIAGLQPFRLSRINYDQHEPFKSRAAPSPYHQQ
jgi:type IV secretion system protein VirD4